MASKTKKPENENILYIQDIDAKVLGIIEGSAQKVYIDNKEVDIVFVDEHEVIPATAEERKLYQDASKLASTYTSIYDNDGKALHRSIVGFKNLFHSSEKADGTSSPWFKNIFSVFNKSNKEREKLHDDLSSKEFKSNVLNSRKNDANDAKMDRNVDYLNKHVKSIGKNDTFTREELNIVKNILANKASKSTPIETKESSKALTTVKKSQASTSSKAKKK